MVLENVILTTENCRYCLMCRHVAPVERVTHKETLSPHGIALVIASLRRGMLTWNPATVDVIYSAADSGNSRAVCVTDQPLAEAIAAVRADIVAQQLAPKVVYQLEEAFQRWGNPYVEKAPQSPTGKGDTALFVGDEAQYLRPAELEAAQRLLKAAGIEPLLIGIGRSNGYLASSLGLPETSKALAQANLDELKASGASRMLVLSPGDYFAFHQLYAERLDIPWPEGCELLEVTSLLAEGLRHDALEFKGSGEKSPYAYVDPTHAVRVPARHQDPRQLLAAIMPGKACELFWRLERAHPVGNTALQFTQPEIAARLTQARLEDARQSGAELLITDDPSTIKHLDEKAGSFDLRVRGLYELMADLLV